MTAVVARMNPVQARAWLALVTTAQLLPSVLDEQLTQDAELIHFEFGILDTLRRAPEHTMRVGKLAAAVASTPPRLSKAISRLERRGLVERLPCQGDGRAINIHLTPLGRRAWVKAVPRHIELARDRILAALTEDQLSTLAELLEPIIARLDPERTFDESGAHE
ncbi:MAG TPA: MarR family transcriptional regulator [Candidatus Dietzia intestinigallinarum]|nr:MarR family transcriptional regulator [Candidatus Dietzia intestinigallinarum]